MPDESGNDEFLELERRYWEAIKIGDAAGAASLSDNPTLIVGAQGARELDKETLGGMMAAAPWQLLEYRIEDVHVRRVNRDTAVVAYKVVEQLLLDGERLSLEAYDSSMWVLRDAQWVCSLHTESLAGDPFGRDKSSRQQR